MSAGGSWDAMIAAERAQLQQQLVPAGAVVVVAGGVSSQAGLASIRRPAWLGALQPAERIGA